MMESKSKINIIERSIHFFQYIRKSKPIVIILNLLLGITLFILTAILVNGYTNKMGVSLFSQRADITEAVQKEIDTQKSTLTKEIRFLQKKIDLLIPPLNYMVINSTENEFSVYNKSTLLHSGRCSTGSLTKLESDSRSWVFQTPKGVFTIRGKQVNPLWRKPDWAFIEEGLPVPPASDPSRYEYGVLGDYALDIGNGYLIHGTLFQRFIGMPVTHGCVRLKDDDLDYVYKNLNVGSKVYIY